MREQRKGRLRARVHPNRRLVLAVIVVAVACLVLIVFVGRQLEIGRRRHRLLGLERAQAEASMEQDALRQRLALADDLETIEMLARERLGLVMPGEEKVIFVEEE